MEKILSISVAAYNMEKYIENCLDSFVKCKLKDHLEILVTDDGSTDRTAEIVQKYADSDPDVIKLIKQKNAGPGSTVNSGIKNATGKYFKMVDSDDWVVSENLEKLVEFLLDTDVDSVFTGCVMYDNDTGETMPNVKNEMEYGKVFDIQCISEKSYDIEMHNMLYKTSILKENNILLDNCFYTDVEYLLMPLPFVKNIVFLNLDIYMYRVSLSTQSMSFSSLQRNIGMHEKVLNNMLKYYDMFGGDFILKRVTKMCGTHLSILLSFKPSKEKKEELKKFFESVQKSQKEIYQEFSKFRTVKILINSKYILYYLVSGLHRKKMGL